jgi:UDP-3-O-[3-hydroxymyristoyl] glucosamine N-acyltransferase
MEMTLREVAGCLGVELRGDGDVRVSRVAELNAADPASIAFLADRNIAGT